MRKTVIILLIAAMLAALFTTACKKRDEGTDEKTNEVIVNVDPAATDGSVSPVDSLAPASEPPADTDAPTPDGSVTDAPTQIPFVTNLPSQSDDPATDAPATGIPVHTIVPSTGNPTPTATVTDAPATGIPVPTIAPTSGPTAAPGQPDYSVFDGCCFIGNSVFEGLHNYGVIKNGTWYTRVGLNILTVYDTPVIGGSAPIIDELNNGSYTGILLMFGQNECGWPDLNNFIRKYERLLQDVWSRQPNAKLFIMGITPVSKAVSDKGENGVTNEHINTINTGLEALAERTQNAYYVGVPQSFYTTGGALQPDASSDGVHLNKAYMQIWADHICGIVSGVL